MPTIRDQIWAAFTANRVTWMLVAAFLYVAYGNYHLREQLDVVCAMTGPYDVYRVHPLSDLDQAKVICGLRHGE
jgi:hypothetical protein